MLQFTGHPLMDVGAAAIAALVNKHDVASLTDEDLEKAADFMAREYVVEPLKSFLNVAFPNSGYTQPAYEKTPEKRAEYSERILRGHRPDTPRLSELCVFTGEQAIGIAFSDKLAPGRVFRQHMPMVTGEGVINFHPWGDPGLPISGKALLCIQAFPLGCAKCGGKLLAVHSDNPDLIQAFAEKFFRQNQTALLLAQQSGQRKMPEAGSSAKTLLIETLLEAEMRRLDEADEHRPFSITAYHLTNSGQSNALDLRNPPLEIYHLPFELIEFLSLIGEPTYRTEWQRMAGRAWRLSQLKKGKKVEEQGESEDTRPRRNYLYEDLFRLPQNARLFLRRYFLRIPARNRFEDDPRRGYSLRSEADLVSWKLTNLFLQKVMGMNNERIQEIRDLGDRMAKYIGEENDRRLFTAFFAERRYDLFRNALLKANLSTVKRGHSPLVTLDPYIAVFEQGDGVAGQDWRLARDLVLIRMIEQLHGQGWLGRNAEAIPDVSDETEQP